MDFLTVNDLLKFISSKVCENKKSVIPNYNLNAIRLIYQNQRMMEFYKHAELIHIDGMPLIFIAQLLGIPAKTEHRITYVDFSPKLFELCANNGYKVYFLGSKPGVFEKAKKKIINSFPNLSIRGHHGYFDSSEESVVINDINSFAPNVLILGMGMPRQEEWILRNLEDLNINVVLTGGAVMDYISGEVPTPPRILGKIGLEWAHRFFSDPRRLWKRYLLDPWVLLPIFFRSLIQRLRGKKERNILVED